ncbi:hypothetical protein PF010_g11163 [Phytophthora fragariae]|uniref:Retrovirus-related Pol polyprotein from transposon TNT 1-94-like beta-barrel domain-containing protein n=1 Tax=Phytophthora fragariae TaxID=53985 RepID=A0A6G0NMH8_9STRA|nr:hypothetical protein PF010_g11163 [Phytophthora fragariae]KAE9214348.1 hypothetical protein PF004_g15073 [Phytophthora fragariae]
MGKYEAQFQSQPRGFERDARLHATLDCRRLCKAEATPRHATVGAGVRRRLCVDGVARRHATSDEEDRHNEEEDAAARRHHDAADRHLVEVLAHVCVTSPATLDLRYGPPPQQRNDGPPPGRGPPPRRGDYRGRGLLPRRRELSPHRFDDRGPRQVNAVAQGRDMQVADPNTVELILDSGSQANVCGDLSLFTTLREDTTSKLDFANGTSEHASICGSVLMQITNLATGELEDRLLDDVVYVPSARVNIISLGYLQTTGKFKLTCSPDQQTAWLSKPGTTLKFVTTANIYRLRVKKVTDVMVMAAVKCKMDS